jgi:hypothetical protein
MVWVRVVPVTICFAAILLITGTHAQLRPPATGTPSQSAPSAVAPPAAPRQISNVTFTMAASDRLPNAAGKTATLSFRAASAIPAGGGITIMFPPNFFPSRISLGDGAQSAATMSVAITAYTDSACSSPASSPFLGAPNPFLAPIKICTKYIVADGTVLYLLVNSCLSSSASVSLFYDSLCTAAASITRQFTPDYCNPTDPPPGALSFKITCAPASAGDVQTSIRPPAPICISGSAPTDCSVQGNYLMSTFSYMCPSNGFYFAPFGLLPNGCPKDVFNMFCQPGLLPAICSDASRSVAALPDACPSGSYFAPDVDAVTKCPAVPQSTPDDGTPRCAVGAAPLDCSIQAQYIMFWFGSVCPFGSYFSPGGIQSDGCPIIQDMHCVPGAVPSGCSELSRKISAIPSVCPYGHFAAPLGLNPESKCPKAPSYAAGLYWPTALTSGSAGATSVSYATFQNANISIGSMRYDRVLVVMSASSIPSGKQTPKAAISFQHTVFVTPFRRSRRRDFNRTSTGQYSNCEYSQRHQCCNV